MIYNETIEGKYTKLRSVVESDAEIIIKLRTDDTKNKFIHATKNDVALQKQWIRTQREKGGDYYFAVIDSKSNDVVGVVSLYNIDEKNGEAELGRWISYGNPLVNLESIALVHEFGYEKLHLINIYTCTMQDNVKVNSFWKKFGGEAEENVKMEDFVVRKNCVSADMYYNVIINKIGKLWR